MTEVLFNPKQIKAHHDTSRHRYLVCGRRGGKTTLAIEWLLKTINAAPRGAEVTYVGPTRQHAIELAWEPMIDAMDDMKWKYKDRISKNAIHLPRGRKIKIMSAAKVTGMRGKANIGVVMDELAYWDNVDLDKAMRAIRPTLSDHRGRMLAMTTPDGKGTQAHEMWQMAKTHPNWGRHHWVTLDNPWIHPEEIEDAKNDLDIISFQQEYQATWESFGDLAYYSFDDDLHVKKQPPINPGKPIYIAMDFNVNPTTLIVRQTEVRGALSYLSYKTEYSLKNSSTEKTLEQFCEDFQNYKESINIKIRGDASGNNRSSNTGKSDYYYTKQILEKHGFQYSVEVPSRNPPIVDRVKYLNGWLKPVSGQHRIEFDPSMKETIKDLSSQGLNGRHPDPKGNLGHKADAVGYDVYYEQRGYANQKSKSWIR